MFFGGKAFLQKTLTISEDNIIKQSNVLGDVRVFAKLLQGGAIFAISLGPGAEDKIGLVVDLLKQSASDVEYTFVNYRSVSIKYLDPISKS